MKKLFGGLFFLFKIKDYIMNFDKTLNFLKTLILNLELTCRLLFDFRVSRLLKILYIAVLIGYFLFPIDFLPDFIPVAGQMDDLMVFIMLMTQFIKTSPIEIVEEHKQSILNGDWKIGVLKFLSGS